MIKRLDKILERAYFARNVGEIELNVTNPSYENALAVEETKDYTLQEALKPIIDDIVKVKQTYPSNHMSTVTTSVDIVVFEGKDFRELKKLVNGLFESRLQGKCSENEQ